MRRSFCSARRSLLFRSVCIFCGWARLICSFTRASRTTSSTLPAERPQETPSAGSPSSEAFFSFRAFSPLTGRSRAAARSMGGRIRSSAAMPPSARSRWRSASPTVIIFSISRLRSLSFSPSVSTGYSVPRRRTGAKPAVFSPRRCCCASFPSPRRLSGSAAR